MREGILRIGDNMKREDIKDSLTKQLISKGAMVSHFEDLVNDYLAFWDTKNKLQKDISDRGVVYEDLSSVGVKMQKNNTSVNELVKVNRQMLSILKDLGLETSNVQTDDDEEM